MRRHLDGSFRPEAVGRDTPGITTSVNLVALEARLLVCAVTEGFVCGFSTATQRNTVTVPSVATAAIPHCQVAVEHQRTVLYRLDS